MIPVWFSGGYGERCFVYDILHTVRATLLVFTPIQKADPGSERADFPMGGPPGYGWGWDLDKRPDRGPGVELFTRTVQSGDKWWPALAKWQKWPVHQSEVKGGEEPPPTQRVGPLTVSFPSCPYSYAAFYLIASILQKKGPSPRLHVSRHVSPPTSLKGLLPPLSAIQTKLRIRCFPLRSFPLIFDKFGKA